MFSFLVNKVKMERKLICVLEDIEREIKRHVVNEKPPHDNVAVILYAHLVAVELALKESKEKRLV